MATKRERQKSLEIMRSGWGDIEMRVRCGLFSGYDYILMIERNLSP
jgi:hypothetical protein